jgi:hypothetical protein
MVRCCVTLAEFVLLFRRLHHLGNSTNKLSNCPEGIPSRFIFAMRSSISFQAILFALFRLSLNPVLRHEYFQARFPSSACFRVVASLGVFSLPFFARPS